MKKTITLLLFNDVEVLDFAGPFEVFSVTNELSGYALFDIRTVSLRSGAITARNGLTVVPPVTIADIRDTDILIIPGGAGTRPLLQDEELVGWIRRVAEKAELVLSVCTGALLLAKADLLGGLQITTHHQVFDELEALAPSSVIERDKRFIDTGKIITSAGISAGIDMSLHVIERLYGRDVAEKTAAYMEYRRAI